MWIERDTHPSGRQAGWRMFEKVVAEELTAQHKSSVSFVSCDCDFVGDEGVGVLYRNGMREQNQIVGS